MGNPLDFGRSLSKTPIGGSKIIRLQLILHPNLHCLFLTLKTLIDWCNTVVHANLARLCYRFELFFRTNWSDPCWSCVGCVFMSLFSPILLRYETTLYLKKEEAELTRRAMRRGIRAWGTCTAYWSKFRWIVPVWALQGFCFSDAFHFFFFNFFFILLFHLFSPFWDCVTKKFRD